mmetsp:Transcript_23969/g.40764  ORF Transcript_23969/g.40764 Transcript_23969/m.40764 type:complete len:117 (+) Transcript_23969:123-473(+)
MSPDPSRSTKQYLTQNDPIQNKSQFTSKKDEIYITKHRPNRHAKTPQLRGKTKKALPRTFRNNNVPIAKNISPLLLKTHITILHYLQYFYWERCWCYHSPWPAPAAAGLWGNQQQR